MNFGWLFVELLNKPPEQLVMNQSDTYRQTQELRYLIDRTIPSMDYGKGCEYLQYIIHRYRYVSKYTYIQGSCLFALLYKNSFAVIFVVANLTL